MLWESVFLACLWCVSSSPIEPFPLGVVSLSGTNTEQSDAFALNRQYLIDILPIDSILWPYKINAGLPAPGVPFGG
jgi:hypothetical protein